MQLSGNVLTVRGGMSEEKEDKGKHSHMQERRLGEFFRSMQLPSDRNPEKVDTTFNDGGLSITLEKSAETKARKIQVRAK